MAWLHLPISLLFGAPLGALATQTLPSALYGCASGPLHVLFPLPRLFLTLLPSGDLLSIL